MNINKYKTFKFFRCSYEFCRICPLSSDHFYIKFDNNFYLPLCMNTSCNSKGIIYIIKCSLCSNIFYIGESGRTVQERIYENIKDIISFKPYYKYKNVSFHFN